MASLHSTLTANSDNYITVGKTATDLGITLKFTTRRGSLNCMGTIKVSSPFTDYVDPAPLLDFDPPAGVGITAVVAEISGVDIRIKVTVDNASVTDVTMDYNLSVVKGTKDVMLSPRILYDGNTFAYYDRLIPSGVVKDVNGVESIYWDLSVGNSLRGAEESTGTTVGYGVYEITATQADHFYVGCQVGDIFPAAAGITLNASNKVKRVIGNHACQPVATKRPINGVFDGVDDFMRTPTIASMIQPIMIYSCINQITWGANKALIDGSTSLSGAIYQQTASNNLALYAGSTLPAITDLPLNTLGIIRALIKGATSRMSVNKLYPKFANAGASNMTGITLGVAGGLPNNYANIQITQAIFRKIEDTPFNETDVIEWMNRRNSLGIGGDIACFGDSLTANSAYPVKIGTVLSMSTTNYGLGGTQLGQDAVNTIYNKLSMSNISLAIKTGNWSDVVQGATDVQAYDGNDYRQKIKAYSLIDFNHMKIISLFFGTNDFGNSRLIGANSDTTPVTFKGAINYIISNIRNTYPSLTMYFFAPTWRSRIIAGDGKESNTNPNSAGIYLIEYVDALLEVCALNNVNVYDTYRLSDINSAHEATYLSDGLHLSVAGAEYIGQLFADQISPIINL